MRTKRLASERSRRNALPNGPRTRTLELEGRSLIPLIRNVDAKWDEAAVSTIGRGTHSVSTGDWRYVRYFDGSEELYDLKRDPREWFNLAGKEEHASLKRKLAAHMVLRAVDERALGSCPGTRHVRSGPSADL